MKTDAINYDEFYNEARKLFFETNEAYTLDRKTESLAYLIALETALRVSDLLTLRYEDFTFNKDLNTYIFTTKIKKTNVKHTSVISKELYNHLQSFRNEIKKSFNLNPHIFWNYNNSKFYTRQWLHKRIKLLSEDLKMDNISMHSLRRASAIKVLDKTGSLSLAQYQLSHKRASTTDKYLNVTQKTALEQLSKVF